GFIFSKHTCATVNSASLRDMALILILRSQWCAHLPKRFKRAQFTPQVLETIFSNQFFNIFSNSIQREQGFFSILLKKQSTRAVFKARQQTLLKAIFISFWQN